MRTILHWCRNHEAARLEFFKFCNEYPNYICREARLEAESNASGVRHMFRGEQTPTEQLMGLEFFKIIPHDVESIPVVLLARVRNGS